MEHRATIITNIFNEEYLLPFWLDYHRRIFDHGIVIDYDSTDRSIEIIRSMCPTWEIRRTKHIVEGKPLFETVRISEECREVEQSITSGYKIYLNTTEWLMLTKPLHELIDSTLQNKCYPLHVYLPLYSAEEFYPKNTEEFIENFNHSIVKAKYVRGFRFIFNRDHGHYDLGRHFTYIPSDMPPDLDSYHSMRDIGMCVFWCGYYPINEMIWNRKLAIKNNMNHAIEYQPQFNRNTSVQHFYSLEQMKEEYAEYLSHPNRVDEFQDAIQYATNLVSASL
jgi:5'(3')-deoxyribonucleotidase